MNELFEKLQKAVADSQGDLVKATGKNKAAGTRLRAQMQGIKAIAQEIREAVLALSKG